MKTNNFSLVAIFAKTNWAISNINP